MDYTKRFPHQTAFYKGKVRDVYTIADKYLVMITSNRISAFDCILPEPIPYKGQVLNEITTLFLNLFSSSVPNWYITSPHPNVLIGHKCMPFKVEMVIRGYLAGHAWREYKLGKREICGVSLPDGLKENDRLPFPIITPTTKASKGHDEDISKDEIIRTNLVSQNDYEVLEKYTHTLYKLGCEYAKQQGLILVDTKYEFGKLSNGTILLMDEIHTADSSRYFYSETYDEIQLKGEKQKQLSKEFVREWLIKEGFQGQESQKMPTMTPEIIETISQRYIELYEIITGKPFIKKTYKEEDIDQTVQDWIFKNIL